MKLILSYMTLALFTGTALYTNAGAEALTWNGGPVVSNARVVMVNWSSDVSAAQAEMPAFYTDIVTSDYWTILEQYATPTTPSQSIGLGSFGGTYTLPQSGCGSSGCAVSDDTIRSYLTSLINSNNPALPPLVFDSQGLLNTIFVVHFAHNVQVQIDNGGEVIASCIAFVATYENLRTDAAHGNVTVPVGIVPDCGSPLTFAASLVVAGMVTDPTYTIAPGWLDDSGSDVAFICRDDTATITAGGHTYGVVPLWSNSSNTCISSERIFAGGFEVPPT
jgi:hypothetical protein